jgi:8-oxo-dGTP diphosphatase
MVAAIAPRSVVRDLVTGVSPHDLLEERDRQWILDWIDSGAQLFRLAKPATPPQHLAVYAALLDEESGSLLYVHHAKAKAFLMPGGHVDDGEDPRHTDVTLWFAFAASRAAPIKPDPAEFSQVRWFPLDEPTDDQRFGPEVGRAVAKLSATLDRCLLP